MSYVLLNRIKHQPQLDPEFVPAALWNREYRKLAMNSGNPIPTAIVLGRNHETMSPLNTILIPHGTPGSESNRKYVEHLVRFLLWQKGGCSILASGEPETTNTIADCFSKTGTSSFDAHFVANRIFGHEIQIGHCSRTALPENNEQSIQLGRHLDGCRIGFDLGGSDRKAAAVADGNVVFTEEIPWNPYFEKNPQYHINGIRNTIERAATHLPRVDAIGGSAAGVYVDNRVHVASLFRGIAEDDFDQHIKNIFPALQKEWDVPFAVVNDGEVAALAGSMAMNDSSVLGISMGTSLAAGYVTTQGNITSWLNELAFAPIDYSDTAPIDEWSGRRGCGVQYFSQQAVARLAPRAGIELPREMPMAEQLLKVQTLMLSGDNRATAIFETIGVYLGYALAHYADFYDFRNVLLLGRVTSGPGGELIVTTARTVLKDEFPDLYNTIQMHMPGEREKRHGQAVAAASLPALSTMEATIS